MNKKIIKMFMGVLLIANILVPGYALDKSKNNIDQLQLISLLVGILIKKKVSMNTTRMETLYQMVGFR